MKKLLCGILTVLLFCIGISGLASADGGLTNRISLQKKYGNDFYSEGMYKVGTDIPAGEYIVFASQGSGYFCRSADSNMKDIIENDNFDYNSIIFVNDGEYFELSRSFAIPFDKVSNNDIDLSGAGMFKAGVNIPAGEYAVVSDTGRSGYYAVYNERNNCKIVANNIFDGKNYVTVYDGQYVELSNCKFDPTPAKMEKVYTDAETIKAVQEALNAAGYDCGAPDGSAGPNTQAQILKYQQDNDLPETGVVSESFYNSLFGIQSASESDDSTSTLVTETEPGITWTQLARTPDDYIGQELSFIGEIVQVMEGEKVTQFRLAIDGNRDEIIYCEIDKTLTSTRLLDKDIVEVNGNYFGLFTYETVMGGKITIPAMIVSSVMIYE